MRITSHPQTRGPKSMRDRLEKLVCISYAQQANLSVFCRLNVGHVKLEILW